jgi:hypothetical protein
MTAAAKEASLMSPRPKLTLLYAALAASLGLAMPVSAKDRDGKTPAPAFNRVAPGPDSQNRRLKDAPQPADEPQTPTPGGCPLREGKLELLA